ncbi:MAG: hypothetical protein QOF41_2305 [Methylobacteriaceae bacterium]|jgi:hypothetical protein|nr:hypothetical protein [Methylobacteriaceae bacterium]
MFLPLTARNGFELAVTSPYQLRIAAHTLRSFGTRFYDISVGDAEGADVLRLFFERGDVDRDQAA